MAGRREAISAVLELREVEGKVRKRIEPWLKARGERMPGFRNLATSAEFYAYLSNYLAAAILFDFDPDKLFDPAEATNMRKRLCHISRTLISFAIVYCNSEPCHKTFQKLALLATSLQTILHLLSRRRRTRYCRHTRIKEKR